MNDKERDCFSSGEDEEGDVFFIPREIAGKLVCKLTRELIETLDEIEDVANVVIPDSVTSIGVGAFRGYDNLKSVKIPQSVTSVEESAFEGCTSLKSVKIPDSVTSIGDNAFDRCDKLASVEIPANVKLEDAFPESCRVIRRK